MPSHDELFDQAGTLVGGRPGWSLEMSTTPGQAASWRFEERGEVELSVSVDRRRIAVYLAREDRTSISPTSANWRRGSTPTRSGFDDRDLRPPLTVAVPCRQPPARVIVGVEVRSGGPGGHPRRRRGGRMEFVVFQHVASEPPGAYGPPLEQRAPLRTVRPGREPFRSCDPTNWPTWWSWVARWARTTRPCARAGRRDRLPRRAVPRVEAELVAAATDVVDGGPGPSPTREFPERRSSASARTTC